MSASRTYTIDPIIVWQTIINDIPPTRPLIAAMLAQEQRIIETH